MFFPVFFAVFFTSPFAHSHNILCNVLPCVLRSLLHKPFCPQTLNIHVGHGSVACRCACLPKLVARLVAILVLHHLHTVLLQVVPQHLRVRLQTVVDSAVGHQASSCCVHQSSHGTSSLLDSTGFVGVDHLSGQVGGHPLGQVAHPVRHVAGNLHRRVRRRHSCFDRVLGKGAHLCILVRLAQPLLGGIGDILDQLTRLLRSHLDTNGELLSAPNDRTANLAKLLLRWQLLVCLESSVLLQECEKLSTSLVGDQSLNQDQPHAAARLLAVNVGEHDGTVLCLEAGRCSGNKRLGPPTYLKEDIARVLGSLGELEDAESLRSREGADVSIDGDKEDLDGLLQLEQLVGILGLVPTVVRVEVCKGSLNLLRQVTVRIVCHLFKNLLTFLNFHFPLGTLYLVCCSCCCCWECRWPQLLFAMNARVVLT